MLLLTRRTKVMTMKICVIMKSYESYKRLVNSIDHQIEWDYLGDLNTLRSKISISDYDHAILDQKIWWSGDAKSLLNSFEVECFEFEGDFNEVQSWIEGFYSDDSCPSEESELNAEENHIPADDRPIRYIEKERVVEKEVKVKVPEYKEMFTSIPNNLIVVCNLTPRAGSTFVSINLAAALTDLKVLTSVIEPPIYKPYLFDMLDMEDRINKKGAKTFYSFPHEIAEGEQLKPDQEVIEEDIIWAIPDARKEIVKKWTLEDMVRLIYSSKKASVQILDVGSNLYHSSVFGLLHDADQIICLIDPLPSDVMQNKEEILQAIELKEQGYHIDFVLNKMNSGIPKKEVERELSVDFLSEIPYINPELVYSSVYKCNIPYNISDIKKELEVPYHSILKKILPKDMWLKVMEDEKKGLFSKLFKK